ncbi:hypothetical protein [Falsiroseomonas sp.]|uniref:hypothetical protein n=1 Tax=Falsiroseomonas sp. TaxID=2870721 RepID=UPI003F6FBFE6
MLAESPFRRGPRRVAPRKAAGPPAPRARLRRGLAALTLAALLLTPACCQFGAGARDRDGGGTSGPARNPGGGLPFAQHLP